MTKKRAQQKKPTPAKKSAAKRNNPAKKPRLTKVAVPVAESAANSQKTTEERNAELAARVAPYQFQPGQSGNPNGRPKSKPISDAYRKQLAKLVPDDPKGRTYAELIAEAQVARAIKGDPKAVSEITDRIEGKATQPISGEDGGPINFSVSHLTPEERDRQLAEAAERLGYRR